MILTYDTTRRQSRTRRPGERRRPQPNGHSVEAFRGRRLLSGVELGGQRPRLVGVDLDAGAHGRGEDDLLDVASLGRGRLETQHLVEGGGVVLDELALAEGHLADDEVQVRVPVDTELDLAA